MFYFIMFTGSALYLSGEDDMNIIWTPQQTQDTHLLLDQCWSSVADGGLTLIQQWVSDSCLLGLYVRYTPKKSTRVWLSVASDICSCKLFFDLVSEAFNSKYENPAS